MLEEDEPGSRELRKIYRKKFGGKTTLHHLRPTTRNGPDSMFNLFPWDRGKHSAWHTLFLNMTLREVWDVLEQVHQVIFDSGCKSVAPWWLAVCETNRNKKKRNFELSKARALKEELSTRILRENWEGCFGSPKLADARHQMQWMMLFMILGMNMLKGIAVASDEETCEFCLKAQQDTEDRAWAFGILFGSNPAPMKVRGKISKIFQIMQSSS